MSKIERKTILLFIAVLLAVIWLYYSAFTSYFFQDDWFSFSISSASSIKDFFGFFTPRENLIYFRPLGIQIPFWIVHSIFGINPLPFRLATLIIHMINGTLLYYFLRKLNYSVGISRYCALLYLTSAGHFTIFYWAATFSFILAPTYYLLILLFYLNKRYFPALLIFISGLMTNELLVTIPLIITLLKLIHNKKNDSINLISYWVTGVIYILFRFSIARFSTSDGYSLVSNYKEVFQNIRNYLFWSFNWPETISDHFVKFLQFQPSFITSFHTHIYFFRLGTLIFLLTAIIIPLVIRFKLKQLKLNIWNTLFGLIWFVGTLFPVLIFSHHSFTYYIAIPLIGLLICLCEIIPNSHTQRGLSAINILLIISFIAWYGNAIRTVRLNTFIHWAPQRADRAEKLVKEITTKYPKLPMNTVVLIDGSSEDKWAMADQYALQVIYRNPYLVTFYGNKTEYIRSSKKEKFDMPFYIELP